MNNGDLISDFTRRALLSGNTPEQVSTALAQAGWSGDEIDAALEGWAVQPGLPPIPRPRPYISAAEAMLYGLLFLSLAMISWHIVVIGFAVIERVLPDTLNPSRNAGWLRWSVAAVTAFLPFFLYLTRRMNRPGKGDVTRRRSLVRKWVASVTLLIVALTLLGDLVAVVYAFLNGDLTAQFLAKAGFVALMGGLIFAYYRDELDG